MNDRNEAFDDLLNSCYDVVRIAGIEFWPADILFECDPIAYRCALSDSGYDDDEES